MCSQYDASTALSTSPSWVSPKQVLTGFSTEFSQGCKSLGQDWCLMRDSTGKGSNFKLLQIVASISLWLLDSGQLASIKLPIEYVSKMISYVMYYNHRSNSSPLTYSLVKSKSKISHRKEGNYPGHGYQESGNISATVNSVYLSF